MVQASGACQCRHAQEVVRRGGSEFDCTVPTAHPVCMELTAHLNAVALPALGYEDDLTLTPKSVYERILICALQGIRMMQDPKDTRVETPDIWAAVGAARERYASISDIPPGDFLPAIEHCQYKKRRRK